MYTYRLITHILSVSATPWRGTRREQTWYTQSTTLVWRYRESSWIHSG